MFPALPRGTRVSSATWIGGQNSDNDSEAEQVEPASDDIFDRMKSH